jgi:hypothetical protein
MSDIGLGTIRAAVEVDSRSGDAALQSTAEKFAKVGSAAQEAAQKVVQAGEQSTRAQQLQERATERYLRAWNQELIQQDRATQKDAELSRARELAALKADILARSTEHLSNATEHLNEAVSHSVPQMAAASASIRVLEGNLTNNVRAAERFLTTTLGLGSVLEAAFPIAGAVAMAGVLFELGGRVKEFGEEAWKLSDELGTDWLSAAILKLEGFGKKIEEQQGKIEQFRSDIDSLTQGEKERSYRSTGETDGQAMEATQRLLDVQTRMQGLRSMLPVQQQVVADAQEKLEEAQNPAHAPHSAPFNFGSAFTRGADIASARQALLLAQTDLQDTKKKIEDMQSQMMELARQTNQKAEPKLWAAQLQTPAPGIPLLPFTTGHARVLNMEGNPVTLQEAIREDMRRQRVIGGLSGAEPTGFSNDIDVFSGQSAHQKAAQAQVDALQQQSITRYMQMTGALSAHNAAVDMARAHEAEFTATMDDLNEQLNIVKRTLEDPTLSPEERNKAMQDQQRAQEQIRTKNAQFQDQALQDMLATRTPVQQFFEEIAGKARNLDQQMEQIGLRSVEDFNSAVVDAINGKKGGWKRLLDDFLGGMEHAGLEGIEGIASGSFRGKGSGFANWFAGMGASDSGGGLSSGANGAGPGGAHSSGAAAFL